MLIIPLEKAFDWKRPPLATLLLVIINLLVFFIVQAGDTEALYTAFEYYLNSNLPAIEFPAYQEYAQTHQRPIEPSPWPPSMGAEDPEAAVQLLLTMESDAAFMDELRANRMVTEADSRFAEWVKQRHEYEQLMSAWPTRRYGFVPNEHRPATFGTHMFLHADFDHLLGNMMFLVILGMAVELALGAGPYLLAYLASGLLSVSLYWAVYPESGAPLIGASGAVAGLMGLYAAVYGLRKIRFFYTLLFYFDYVRAPALILLPLWLAKEFYQLGWGGQSNVAYVAHIGGLLAGGGLGFLMRRGFGRVDLSSADAAELREQRTVELSRGMKLLADMEIDRARSVFRALHAKDPRDRDALRQLYNTEKLTPTTSEFHRTASKVLSLPGQDTATRELVRDTFLDYVRSTGGKLRLSSDILLKLAFRFSKASDLDLAERIIQVLLKTKPLLEGLDLAMLALAQGWQQTNRPDKANKYFALARRAQTQSAQPQPGATLARRS